MRSGEDTGAEGPMPGRFASPRERRLWVLAGVLVATIYATLGLQRRLVDAFGGNQDLINSISFWGAMLIFASIVVHGVRNRPHGLEVGILIGIFGAYAMLAMRTVTAFERSHLIEYSVLALLVRAALLERDGAGREVARPGLLAFAATSAIGIVDELLQLAIPSRVFDPVDIAFNVFAAGLAVGGVTGIGWVRRKVASTR